MVYLRGATDESDFAKSAEGERLRARGNVDLGEADLVREDDVQPTLVFSPRDLRPQADPALLAVVEDQTIRLEKNKEYVLILKAMLVGLRYVFGNPVADVEREDLETGEEDLVRELDGQRGIDSRAAGTLSE